MGERVGDRWIVTSGLSAGERIVVEGLQEAKSGQLVDPKPFATSSARVPEGV